MASAAATSTCDFVEVVRSKIVKLVGNAPTSSVRSSKLKQIGQKVLDRISEASNYKSTSGKRTKLLSTFHQIHIKSDSFVHCSWKKLLTDLDVDEGDDWLLMQELFRKMFDYCVHRYFQTKSAETQSTEITLTRDELNALRYACGYVAKST